MERNRTLELYVINLSTKHDLREKNERKIRGMDIIKTTKFDYVLFRQGTRTERDKKALLVLLGDGTDVLQDKSYGEL